jgi:hypothetical protein
VAGKIDKTLVTGDELDLFPIRNEIGLAKNAIRLKAELRGAQNSKEEAVAVAVEKFRRILDRRFSGNPMRLESIENG